MPDEIRIFVNEQGHSVPAGATVRDAIALAVPALLPLLDAAGAQVTDARGLPLSPETPLTAGAILRASRSSRRAAAEPEGD